MKQFYQLLVVSISLSGLVIVPEVVFSQACANLKATFDVTESRCAATGSMQVHATGGTGNYQYQLSGPTSVSYTSSSLITGLATGYYLVTVKDIQTNCIFNKDSVLIPGNYQVPNFTMGSTGVTCMNGTDGTISLSNQVFGRGPFLYTIIAPSASKIGTVSSTGSFTGLSSGNYLVQLSDSCGALQTRSIDVADFNWITSSAVVTKNCTDISVVFTLKDDHNNTTPNAVFNKFQYGISVAPGDTTWFTTNSFTFPLGGKHLVNLFAKDNCGNMQSTVWIDNAVPKVSNTVAISNYACATFSATVKGQQNLSSPSFCIYDNNSVLVACNTTGVFDLLTYGSYCIKIVNSNCYDTTISRCFTVNKPVPSVDSLVSIVTTCTSVTASITGQLNIYNGNYCLYNASNVLVGCNSTGVFANLPNGNFCIKITNNAACYDTVITRCFTVRKPVPSVNNVVALSNFTCATFTATITDTVNLNNPQFCLFNAAHVSISCNGTGVFNNLAYGTYCINIVNAPGCYDTTIARCFTVVPPPPAVNSTVAISNNQCTTFTASITGQSNINNAQYCLYNSLNLQVACNLTGVFSSVPYGSYCIKIKNDAACYDTTISRCFSVSSTPVNISLSSSKSCTVIGTSDIKVKFNSGIAPYQLVLFSPTGTLLTTVSASGSNYTFASVPSITSPLQYKVVVTDQCGNIDSLKIYPTASMLNRVITKTPKCPSALWSNGSADVVVDETSTNILGAITPSIISVNGSAVAINASSSSGLKYTFLDLGPGTYIFDTYITGCSKHLYDTVIVNTYVYPTLSGSQIFQCDNGAFNVIANATNGKSPVTYEIFGSSPSTPSIISPLQASPLFTINNGTSYSLIRLRAVDACGNASLYDGSVHPLANFIVTPTSAECFNESLTLTLDSLPGATYTWYKRTIPNDSVVVGTGTSYTVPVLAQTDTGRYVAKIIINSGCLTKYANYVITGTCRTVLPVGVTLTGVNQPARNILYWNKSSLIVKAYILEKSSKNSTGFQTINTFADNVDITQFAASDANPFSGSNFYRVNVKTEDNQDHYTNTLWMQNTRFALAFYPNPVQEMMYISVSNITPRNYNIEMIGMAGQKIFSKIYYNLQNAVIKYPRAPGMPSGIYSVVVTDIQTNERQTFKVDFK